MIDPAIFLMILGGFSSLLMAMPRHQQDWLARKLLPAASLRFHCMGIAMLTLSLLLSISCLGPAYGIVTWTGWLTITALVVVLLHTNREPILRWAPR